MKSLRAKESPYLSFIRPDIDMAFGSELAYSDT